MVSAIAALDNYCGRCFCPFSSSAGSTNPTYVDQLGVDDTFAELGVAEASLGNSWKTCAPMAPCFGDAGNITSQHERLVLGGAEPRSPPWHRPQGQEREAVLEALCGRWLQQNCHEACQVFEGSTVRGPDGTEARVVVEAWDRISVPRCGVTHRAQLLGDELYWTDGDVWFRENAGRAGLWPQAACCWEHHLSAAELHEPQRPANNAAAAGTAPASAGRAMPPTAGLAAVGSSAAPGTGPGGPEAVSGLRRRSAPLAVGKGPHWPVEAIEDCDSPLELRAALPLDGHWRHKSNPEIQEVIRGRTIHGPDGTTTTLRLQGENTIAIEFDGRTHSAQLVEDQLVWDDGDVWIPYEVPQRFNGRWTHKSNPGLVEVVTGDTIFGMDGTQRRLTLRGPDAFTIQLGGRSYHAQLVGDQLVWDDGDIWLRGGPFDGRWAHKANPMLKEVIKDDVIHRPGGTRTHLAQEGEDSFCILDSGAQHKARLENNQLVWDDGDVWILMPEQTVSEQEENEFDQAAWISEVRHISLDHEGVISQRERTDCRSREKPEAQESPEDEPGATVGPAPAADVQPQREDTEVASRKAGRESAAELSRGDSAALPAAGKLS